MTTPSVTGTGRQTLTFSLNGLSARDETLFKSFVRLLAHRTLQQWSFAPQDADICVAAQDAANNMPADGKTLVVGGVHQGETHFVHMPFHADALEQVLNQLGTCVTAERHARVSSPADHAQAAQFRLLRWPPANLLASSDHMRLAALMTGKWTTLADLHQRSGVPMQVCLQFVADLQHATLLAPATQAAHAPLSSDAHAAHDTFVKDTHCVQSAHIEPGLISRIRSRLGLFSAGRT